MENKHTNTEVIELSVEQYNEAINQLATKIDADKYSGLYPIPRGGYMPAIVLSQLTGLPIHTALEAGSLVVDDLIDSGRTLEQFKDNDKAVVYAKNGNVSKTTYYAQEISGWIKFPDENNRSIEDSIVRIFQFIGEDATREGLIDTPARMAKMWKEIFRGYDNKQKPKITTFQNGTDGIVYDNMVIDTGTFYSVCEHHFMPFFGTYYFAYTPNPKGRILGLSKIARVVDFHAAKMQIQERLVSDVVQEIEAALGSEYPPLGIALVMEAEHLCKTMRGVKKQGKMVAARLTGVFKEPATRAEFMQYVNSRMNG